jgi:hypothetical protein
MDGGGGPLDAGGEADGGAPPVDGGETGGGSAPADGGPHADGGSQSDGGVACGYRGRGARLEISSDIAICTPPVVCDPETCPPPLGECVNGRCTYRQGYQGLRTLPEAWVTYYCMLSGGGCHGVTQINYPEVNAQHIADHLGYPLCSDSVPASTPCVGIAASSPMVVGNSQVAVDPSNGRTVSTWGLGLTEASGLCYELTGPGGVVLVALTDRCGGYCRCGGNDFQECGACVNASDLTPQCPCVGSAPPLYSGCCGQGCAMTLGNCDWCASNNHPHFDLDTAAFNRICGAQAQSGSCQLTRVRYLPCMDPSPSWPPGGGGGSCGAQSFQCQGQAASHQDLVPGTSCCCNWNLCPNADGTCGPGASPCGAGSCPCGENQPDTDHPRVPSTGCCCVFGAAPKDDGTCG